MANGTYSDPQDIALRTRGLLRLGDEINSISQLGDGLTKKYEAFNVKQLILDKIEGQEGSIVIAGIMSIRWKI